MRKPRNHNRALHHEGYPLSPRDGHAHQWQTERIIASGQQDRCTRCGRMETVRDVKQHTGWCVVCGSVQLAALMVEIDGMRHCYGCQQQKVMNKRNI